MKALSELRQAGAVRRYHTTRTIRTQSVAEHSFGVAQLVLYLQPKSSVQVLSAALHHDLPELTTGDIPAPAKWASSSLCEALSEIEQGFITKHGLHVTLTSKELRLLRWCDMADMVLWCQEELHMGNKHVKGMLKRGLNSLREQGFINERVERFYNELSKR